MLLYLNYSSKSLIFINSLLFNYFKKTNDLIKYLKNVL